MRDGRAADNARRATPEYLEKRRAAYAARKAVSIPATIVKRPRRYKANERPFVGIDGEGCGTDDSGSFGRPGRQLYMLLRAGEDELYTGKPLSSRECLAFLTGLPKGPIYVGFSIGYDITMMLRDWPPERMKRLLNPASLGKTGTYYGGFTVKWLPKNYLWVGRTYRDERGIEHYIKGSGRTFYEVFGFFQKSFLKVLHEFGIGSEAELETIERNKAARGHFAGEGLSDDMFCPFITDEERGYCALEVRLLAQLMEDFRGLCIAGDIKPHTWNGAGKLSAALHRRYETMTTEEVAARMPVVCECPLCAVERPSLPAMAFRAYFGGRFETTRHGDVGELYEADIRSAYPYLMTQLPCLAHGEWRAVNRIELGKLGSDALFIAPVRFKHVWPKGTTHANLCGLPIRQKDGRIFWPMEGNGTYWSCELRAAAKLGCRVSYRGQGWLYEKRCDCHPFNWLATLYAYRKSLDTAKGSVRGYPIKLGINGTYGKLVQRVGDPRWANMIWGGLITAGTRAMLMDAAAHNPESVVMLATDGIFSRVPLPLDYGPELGQWEQSHHEHVHIVQPGVYFGASRPKTRGVPPAFFYREDKPADQIGPGETYVRRFERAWQGYYEQRNAALGDPDVITGFPSIQMPVRLFIGTKLALSYGKLHIAGTWVEQMREFRYRWTYKRGAALAWEGRAGWSWPAPGSATLISRDPGGDEVSLMDISQGEMDDQPDWMELTEREH